MTDPAEGRFDEPALPSFAVPVRLAAAAPRVAGDAAKVPHQRPRGRRAAAAAAPLGSISAAPVRTAPGTVTCTRCGSGELTHLEMTLTDGSPVIFVSCHACEHKGWFAVGGAGEMRSLESVIDSATKER